MNVRPASATKICCPAQMEPKSVRSALSIMAACDVSAAIIGIAAALPILMIHFVNLEFEVLKNVLCNYLCVSFPLFDSWYGRVKSSDAKRKGDNQTWQRAAHLISRVKYTIQQKYVVPLI